MNNALGTLTIDWTTNGWVVSHRTRWERDAFSQMPRMQEPPVIICSTPKEVLDEVAKALDCVGQAK